MVVTVSGTAGTGKTTVAKYVVDRLRQTGTPVEYVRFRFLPCFRLLQPSPRGRPGSRRSPDPPPPNQASTPARRPLGFSRFLVYWSRILAFRVYAALRLRRTPIVLDRYFYDNFAHLTGGSRPGRALWWVLEKTTPVPDLAIVLMARADTIIGRRPGALASRLEESRRGYEEVLRRFPHTVGVWTDESDDVRHALDALISERLTAPR